MKDIRFKKVVLNGFRGQTREIVFNDGLTKIVGSNGTGKTTAYVAAKWCLTGVDERNRTNYNLFDDTLDFTPENSTPAIAELFVEIDGAEYVLKRQATQKWVRKRGSAEYSKAPSDEYKFYIDGLELSATAYKDRIAEMFNMDVEKLKLCMDVLYYQLLDWKELRKHFADIVGEVKDGDMAGDYSAIMPYLEKYKSGEKAKEFLRQQINPLKQQVKDIDVVIKAQERLLPDLTPVAEAEKQIAEKEARIAEINKEILGLEEANKPYAEKRKAELEAIRKLAKQYHDKEIEFEAEQRKKLLAIQDELEAAENHNANIEKQKQLNEQAIQRHNDAIKLCKEDIEDLTQEYNLLSKQNKEIKAREFTETICPNCGQELPADKIAELRAKFYEDRDIQRAPIVERGKKVRARLDAQKSRLEKLEAEEIIVTDSSTARIDTDEISNRYNEAQTSLVSYSDTDEAKAMMQKISDMDSKLTIIPEVDSAELQEESQRLVAEIKELSQITARRETYNKGTEAIEQYHKDKSSVGVELAKWEGLLDKLMSREREWADIVRERANKYLDYSHVEMTDISKSGELVDTCTLSINGVDRGVTNHANKTIIGIDISNAICKRYDVSMPLFIDDFEHFTSALNATNDRQVITLSANPDYPELTIL